MRFNMWGTVPDRRKTLRLAVEFTRDSKLYGHYMRLVCREWTYSCENALTDKNLNRKAWLGHAACALAHGIPEDIVREAWKHLTDEQRTLANKQAENAIKEWEHIRESGSHLPRTMDLALL